MRIDKFLKVARLIKRRELAKEACNLGMVYINGRVAKPSSEVKEGDIVEIDTYGNYIKIRVLNVSTGPVSKNDVRLLYEVMEERRKKWLEE
ncbi:MAG: RNA-binding S4 domain-containing protein [Thermosulfidibacteraceae bacterium]